MLRNNLILKLIVFISIFLLSSWLVGSIVIPTPLLFSLWFWVYGNLGKILLIFLLLLWLQGKSYIIELFKHSKVNHNSLIISFVSFILLCVYLNGLLGPEVIIHTQDIFISNLLLIVFGVCLVIGIFGFGFLKNLVLHDRKTTLISIIIACILYGGIFISWSYWFILSGLVLNTVKFLLSFFFQVSVVEPYTLVVNNFSVNIGQACSGLDSIFLFSAAYFIIGFLNKNLIDIKKYIITYPILLVGLFSFNIVRVFTIILVGVAISEDLSINLFHNYLGIIFFLLFFVCFMKLVMPKLYK